MSRRWLQALVPVALLAVAISMIWWRGPEWSDVSDSFTAVRWPWVIAAIGLNLVSVLVRALAWNTVIRQAIPSPRPRARTVFSAFCVGLFANAVLPGRVGELGRVAVLARRFPRKAGAWATLIGTVFAHRMFDLFPAVALVAWVFTSAKLPHWALMTLLVVLGAGVALFAFAMIGARRHNTHALEELGKIRALIARARVGLTVMREPVPAASATVFQFAGWVCQLLAVWATLNAFRIYQPLIAAGLVLLMMNVVTVFPFWPGNVGLVQFAIAVSLAQYGVDYDQGVAFGIGLQAIEASVGIGVGTLFLAREGLSYGTLKSIETDAEGSPDARPPLPE